LFHVLNIFLVVVKQDEGDDDDTPNGDVSGGRDLISESELSNSIRDPVEDRQTLAEKNERLQNQLKVCDALLVTSSSLYGCPFLIHCLFCIVSLFDL